MNNSDYSTRMDSPGGVVLPSISALLNGPGAAATLPPVTWPSTMHGVGHVQQQQQQQQQHQQQRQTPLYHGFAPPVMLYHNQNHHGLHSHGLPHMAWPGAIPPQLQSPADLSGVPRSHAGAAVSHTPPLPALPLLTSASRVPDRLSLSSTCSSNSVTSSVTSSSSSSTATSFYTADDDDNRMSASPADVSTAPPASAQAAAKANAASPVAASPVAPSNSVPLKCVCRNNTKTGHHIPRPRNAFILFRQHLHQQLFAKQSASCENTEVSFKTNSQISREIGQRWRELNDADRCHWQDLAAREKELHRKRYPDYKYIPRKSRAGKRQRKDGCEFCKRTRA